MSKILITASKSLYAQDKKYKSLYAHVDIEHKKDCRLVCYDLNEMFWKADNLTDDVVMVFAPIEKGTGGYDIYIQMLLTYYDQHAYKLIEVGAKIYELVASHRINTESL